MTAAAPPPTRRRFGRRLAVLAAALAVAAGTTAARPWRWFHAKQAEPVPEALLREARAAVVDGDYELARDRARKCVDYWPANAETHFLLARACRLADDYTGWQTHLKTAEALQWGTDQVAFERRLMAAQTGRFVDTRQELTDLLDADAADPDLAYEALARGCLDSFRIPDALWLTTQWADERPDDWRPYLYRGRALYRQQALGAAVREYRAALERNPRHRTARLWLAGALLLNGQFPEALPEFEAYTRDYPNDPAGALGLGTCQFELSRLDDAQRTIDKLLAAKPDHAAALLVRGRIELARDRSADALDWFRKAEKAAPYEPEVLGSLILVYRQLNRPGEAAGYQRRVEELKALDKRLSDVRTQVVRNPTDPAPRVEAGKLCLALHRPEAAMDWLLGAITADPDNRAAHEALAECFDQLGEPARAAFHRARAGKK